MVMFFIITAALVHVSGEPTFSETLGFDHQGSLELSALFIYLVVIVALVLGCPFGSWYALRQGGHEKRWITVIVLAVIAPVVGLFAIGLVPSTSGDPVLEPYVLIASAFVTGLFARLLTVSPS
jgi:ABC-type dipeptide/oligopeptide/nickel transport system permease component